MCLSWTMKKIINGSILRAIVWFFAYVHGCLPLRIMEKWLTCFMLFNLGPISLIVIKRNIQLWLVPPFCYVACYYCVWGSLSYSWTFLNYLIMPNWKKILIATMPYFQKWMRSDAATDSTNFQKSLFQLLLACMTDFMGWHTSGLNMDFQLWTHLIVPSCGSILLKFYSTSSFC